MGGSRIGKCYYLFTNVRSKACHSYRHTLKSHPALLSASTSPRDRPRPILVLSSVAASTMSSEESPTSARARSMALARALLERTHSRSDGIPRPTALGAASRISVGQSGCLEVCRAASHLVPACTPSPSGLACCRPACRALVMWANHRPCPMRNRRTCISYASLSIYLFPMFILHLRYSHTLTGA